MNCLIGNAEPSADSQKCSVFVKLIWNHQLVEKYELKESAYLDLGLVY